MELVNQQLIKSSNLKLVYGCISTHSGISRSALAKQTRLSKTTVSALVDELMGRGLIQDLGAQEPAASGNSGSKGRRPNSLCVCSGRCYVIVLLWGRYYIDAHLTDISGTSTPVSRVEARNPSSYVTGSRQCVDSILEQRGLDKNQILGVCIVIPAMIDMEGERIFSTPLHFSQHGDASLIKELKTAFYDFKTAVLNDTACCAYAEKVCTTLHEPDFAFINFDRGIGAALFIRGEMLGHASASYTQFGHCSVDPEGPVCPCGNRGCLEITLSQEALWKQYLLLKGACLEQSPCPYRDLGYAAATGDPDACRVLHGAALIFARALGNLICLVRPRLIVVGGKGRELGDFFLNETERQLKQTGFQLMTDSVTLKYSLLDAGACFVGAMNYFMDVRYSFSQDAEPCFYLG